MTRRSKFGWVDCIVGVVLIALGVYTFIHPQIALSGVIAIYSLLAIVTGITDIVFYVRLKSTVGLGPTTSLVTGILSVLAGFTLLLNPFLGRWIFSFVFPVWFIAHSISRLANYGFIKHMTGKWAAIASLVINIAGIVLGVLMFISPVVSVTSFGYLVALALVLHGVGNLVEAFSRLGEEKCQAQEDVIWQ